jgi:hypothetical protein
MSSENEEPQIINNGNPDEIYVVDGAELTCTLGTSNSNLVIPISHGVYTRSEKQANIGDHICLTNIMPFGPCNRSSPPPPCTPSIPMKWIKGKDDVIVKMNPSTKIEEKYVIETEEKSIHYFEFMNPALDCDIYNIMFFVDIKQRLLMGTFILNTS